MTLVLRLVRRLATLRGVRRLTGVTPLLRLSFALRGSLVCEPLRFAANEVRARPATATYRLRESGVAITLRHHTPDVMVLDEVFSQREYEFPEPVHRVLASRAEGLRVADLGANIGLFGAWILGRFPTATIVALEADPENAAVHRHTIAANRREGTWKLVEGYAATAAGTVLFTAGNFATSRAATGAARAISVRAFDVFPCLADVDFVKIDIEGAEWPILADARFLRLPARAVVLEYHDDFCPDSDARSAGERLLRNAGYEVAHGREKPAFGAGVLWAWHS